MTKTKINAEVVADSLSPQGDRLTSLLITFPRIILAEVNTHRMLTKNTSSSRAIPFNKMVESVQNDPFIPIAWQKHHSGMQGSEYHSKTDLFELEEFVETMHYTFKQMVIGENISEKEYNKFEKKLQEKVQLISSLLKDYINYKKTLDDWWLFARDKAVEAASILYVFDVTKQLCNRLLEPFMWTTMLITGSKEGWDNFFELRCPVYKSDYGVFKSKKDVIKNDPEKYKGIPDLHWLKINKGQAEIHIMDLAEKIYDAMNESTPKQLKAGEWHIPFGDKLNKEKISELEDNFNHIDLHQWEIPVKISTAMAARTSYTVIGDEKEIDYERMIGLHDRLISQNPPHSSPMEHCARAMNDEEYQSFRKGEHEVDLLDNSENAYWHIEADSGEPGWCRNYRGFIQYRHLVEKNLIYKRL